MKRVALLTSLALAFLALPLFLTAPAEARDKDELKDLKVEVVEPFEEAEPGAVKISEVKEEQFKKADHVIIRETEPPRIKDEADVEDFDEADFKKRTVTPFSEADLFSRQTLPFATEKELAGAFEFLALEDSLEGEVDLDKAAENIVQANPRIVHSNGIPTGVGRAPREDTTTPSTDQPTAGTEAATDAGNAGRDVVRFGNRIGENEMTGPADLAHFSAPEAVDMDAPAEEEADHAAEGEAENVLQFSHMIGSNDFNAAVHGIPGASEPMSVGSGSASLDRRNNLNVQVSGLRHADGTSAAGQPLGAGLACMDSGFFQAVGEQGDTFTTDENGNGSFTGTIDFAGRSCVAPTAMIMNLDGSFVAISANPAMDELMSLNAAAPF